MNLLDLAPYLIGEWDNTIRPFIKSKSETPSFVNYLLSTLSKDPSPDYNWWERDSKKPKPTKKMKYPQRPKNYSEEAPDHRVPGIHVGHISTFTAALAITHQAMEAMDGQLVRAEKEAAARNEELADLRYKLEFCEQQEEICGAIARGEFTKAPIPDNGVPSFQRSAHFHNYTESQLAIRSLMQSYQVERQKKLAGTEEDLRRISDQQKVIRTLHNEIRRLKAKKPRRAK